MNLTTFQEADIILAAISVTPQRKEVVDFSHPYLDYGLDILIAKETSEADMFFFIRPFR